MVSKQQKLLAKLLQGEIKNVAFSDFQSLLERLGFELSRVNGSHHIYVHPKGSMMNIQNVSGKVKPYQVRQLLKAMEAANIGFGEH